MELLGHQREAVEIARRRPRFAFYDEPGCGKTMAMLAVCADRPVRTLVLAPKSVMRTAWLGDAAHFPDLRVRCLWRPTAAERRAAIASKEWTVGVTGFEAFKADERGLAAAGIERLVIDESSKIKAHDSQISIACRRFADKVREVYLLSGTPAPNNPTEYFSQLRALGPDASGTESYWQFAYRYATPIKRPFWKGGRKREGISGWTQSDAQRARLAELLARHCRFTRLEDIASMPGQTSRIVEVELSDDERRAYELARKRLVIELNSGERLTINSSASLTKARQITGGSVLADGEPQRVGDAKIREAARQLDEIGPRSCVLWAEFTHEINALAAMIRARGEPVEIIDGSTSWDSERIVREFQYGSATRVVCQPSACAHGITLTRAHYSIFFSLGFSAEKHEQAKRRIYRLGQGDRCHHLYLVAPGTVDEAAYRVCVDKQAVSDAIRESVGAVKKEGVGMVPLET